MPVSSSRTESSVLRMFLDRLSPRRYVRSAAWDSGNGCWTNRYPGRTPLEHVRADRPVAMHLFPETDEYPYLWAFDLDASHAGAEAVEGQARALTDLLRECGLPAVPVVSGPSGGRHLWTACEERLTGSVVGGLVRACRTLAGTEPVPGSPLSLHTLDPAPWSNHRTGALRPPGAAHRAGGHARLVEHDIGEAVALLSEGGTLAGFRRLTHKFEELAGTRSSASVSGQRGGVARAVASGRALPPSVTGDGSAHGPRRRIVLGPGDRHPALADRRPLAEAALLRLRAHPIPRPTTPLTPGASSSPWRWRAAPSRRSSDWHATHTVPRGWSGSDRLGPKEAAAGRAAPANCVTCSRGSGNSPWSGPPGCPVCLRVTACRPTRRSPRKSLISCGGWTRTGHAGPGPRGPPTRPCCTPSR